MNINKKWCNIKYSILLLIILLSLPLIIFEDRLWNVYTYIMYIYIYVFAIELFAIKCNIDFNIFIYFLILFYFLIII